MNDLLEMIAARQPADVAATDRTGDLTAQQHHGDQRDLIDVVALLPASHLSPSDLRRGVEHVERVGSDTATGELVCGNTKIAELELLVCAHEDIERREVSVQRLTAMQRVEDGQDPGDLAADEALRLRPLAREPGAEVSMHRILHGQAVARAGTVGDHESVEHAQRARLTVQELGKI